MPDYQLDQFEIYGGVFSQNKTIFLTRTVNALNKKLKTIPPKEFYKKYLSTYRLNEASQRVNVYLDEKDELRILPYTDTGGVNPRPAVWIFENVILQFSESGYFELVGDRRSKICLGSEARSQVARQNIREKYLKARAEEKKVEQKPQDQEEASSDLEESACCGIHFNPFNSLKSWIKSKRESTRSTAAEKLDTPLFRSSQGSRNLLLFNGPPLHERTPEVVYPRRKKRR